MDFELSEDQQALRDTVRSVLERECPPSAVREVFDGSAGTRERLWHKMVELDWPAIAIPEAFGGLGLGFVELALMVEEMGRAVAPSPFVATVTQFVPMVLEAGNAEQQKSFLGPVVTSGATGALALAEAAGRWDVESVRTTARQSNGGWVLQGQKCWVFDGATADSVAVVARAEGSTGADGIGVFVIPGGSVDAQSPPVIDPSQPLAYLTLADTLVPADGVLIEPTGPAGAVAVRRAVETATAAIAIGISGTCRAIFETTLQYAKDREQFGKPIGSFQAIKHRLVDMYLAVERSSSLAYFAALTIAEEDDRRSIAVSMAKAAAGDCQRLVAQDGLQLHGGIGFMWEQDLHMLLKRAKSSDALFGSANAHRASVARTLGLVP